MPFPKAHAEEHGLANAMGLDRRDEGVVAQAQQLERMRRQVEHAREGLPVTGHDLTPQPAQPGHVAIGGDAAASSDDRRRGGGLLVVAADVLADAATVAGKVRPRREVDTVEAHALVDKAMAL